MFAAAVVAVMLTASPPPADLFAPPNLVAWCVVPFDAAKRGPAERAEMLKRLGFTKFAYDWRDEHLPSFDREVTELTKRGIKLEAVWFPAELDAHADALLAVIRKHKVTPDLWVMVPEPTGDFSDKELTDGHRIALGYDRDGQKRFVAALRLRPVVDAAAKLGCRVNLYPHGGWAGDPEVLHGVLRHLLRPTAGVVLNFHHAHNDLGRLPQTLKLLLPHLHCVNLNGTFANGDTTGRKIMVLGDGPDDLPVLRAIRDSGYRGPIGILGHTQDDAEARLADNLAGLARLRAYLNGKTPPMAKRRTTPPPPPEFAVAADRGSVTYGPTASDAALTLAFRGKPVEGRSRRDGDFVRFTPRFKLDASQKYEVSFGDKATSLVVPADRPPAVPTRVQLVVGLKGAIPENTLRLYVRFSRPMRRGEGLKHVHLTAADGTPVVEPFLDLAEELWNPAGDRLTLLFDPGRVKRDLAPRELLGPILEDGKRYTLTVDAAWPDSNGFPLGEAFTQTFNAWPADRDPIDPAQWSVVPNPEGGSLTVQFEKILDPYLAESSLTLRDAAGAEQAAHFSGTARLPICVVSLRDSPLSFPPGDYTLVVNPLLEDFCGNRVGRAFEIEQTAPAAPAKPVEIPFTVPAK
jgi:sugar phosphate isomerase/epimerase